MDSIYIGRKVVIYCLTKTELEVDDWMELIGPTNTGEMPITYVDFNAHSTTRGASKSSNIGNRLSEAANLCNMIANLQSASETIWT